MDDVNIQRLWEQVRPYIEVTKKIPIGIGLLEIGLLEQLPVDKAEAWDPEKFMVYSTSSGVAIQDPCGAEGEPGINGEELKPLTNKELSEWRKKKNTLSKPLGEEEDQEATKRLNQNLL